ncbi:isochorismatase [Astrocystis sublimbata]|nr:isochorismatase [Astrocystis sublimbata]
MENRFTPALIIVDLQGDFCPPNGALAVPDGRGVIGPINELLGLPFALKVATKDWHPRDHVSFASNHPGKEPFVDSVTIVNPTDATESYSSRLWPVHCVQGTAGAELVPELDVGKLDEIIHKGTDPRFEMYSPFYAPFSPLRSTSTSPSPRVGDSGLAALLRGRAVTHVYVVGLAGDYCVKSCAEDAAGEGFRTYLIEEGTRPVDAGSWPQCKKSIEGSGAKVVSIEGPEVLQLRSSTTAQS